MDWSLVWQAPLALFVFWFIVGVLQFIVRLPDSITDVVDLYRWKRVRQAMRRVDKQDKQPNPERDG
jgi:hypothetical protein